MTQVSRAKEASQPRRQRLDPEIRAEMIMDVTAKIVAEEGVGVITMDLIGRKAGISKSLVYNYFPNVSELLVAVLTRELKRLREAQAEAMQKADTFEGLVRGVTRAYVQHIQERGLIIERLQSEPTISERGDPTQYDRSSAVKALAKLLAKQFGFPPHLAEMVTDISFGIPAAAGAFLLNTGASPEEVEDVTVKMIIGSVTAVATDRMVSQKSLG
ncbi:MAG: TetR/AcrR family transcriptional regulator [Pseudomonadota bacterium]